MRYPASEKLEIIRAVETSHLPVRRTLDKIGIPKTTFYAWLDHPMTQGKIERWHLSLKSRILLENYDLPGDLERAVADFVEHYNHRRYHESLDNVTPAHVDFGRGARILQRRKEIKRRTIEQQRRVHFQAAE